MSRRAIRLLALLAAIGGMPAAVADACSCAMSGPPCQAAWSSDTVFSGVVRSIDGYDRPDLGRMNLVRIEVEHPFRNVPSATVEVETGAGGGDCGYSFQVGKRYVVYASKYESPRLKTSICTRTRPIEEAEEDLRYLRAMPPGAAGVLVFGRVTRWERDPGDDVAVDYGPVAGLTVTARGGAFAREAKTDENGRYALVDVPPGKVQVALRPPPIYDSRFLEHEIELKEPHGCAEFNFQLQFDGQIAGQIFDAGGQPAAGVYVEAVAAEDASAPRTTHHPQIKTDESGRFLLRELSPGSYAVGVNLTHPPESGAPYGPTFFPGTTTASEAVAIELAAGEHRDLAPFRLTGRLAVFPLKVCPVWPDGSPAPTARITHMKAAPRRVYIESPTTKDSDGCVVLRVYPGVSYDVSAFASTPDNPQQRFAAELALTVTGTPAPVRLVLAPVR